MTDAKLDIIIGPMFAGKSSLLIKKIRLLNVLEKKYLVIKPIFDNRYSSDNIVSHDMVKENCLALKNINNIFNYNIIDINTIFIDEAQFFTNLVETVLRLVEENNINVFIVGLDGDSNRCKFGEILDLIPLCDTITKLNAFCNICKDGTYAKFTKRLVSNKHQKLIGTNEYIPVCRKHL